MNKNSFINKIARKSYMDKLSRKIVLMGSNHNIRISNFVVMRIVSTFLIFIGTIYISDLGYILAPFIAAIYYFLYEYLLIDVKINKRSKKLEREALHFFEILTLTLESGRNLENALDVTCFNVESELSNEFKKSLFEIKFGKSLLESLEIMKDRIPSEAVNNIILNITQTDTFGSSILETMYQQIEFLREKQLLVIKEQINKIPNKISIISVVFIVPLIMLMILGPIVLSFMQGTIG